jgi:hypothetical protein
VNRDPWKIVIRGLGAIEGLTAEVTKTRLRYRQQDDSWVGWAKLEGRIVERGSLAPEDALTLLLVFLLHRENDESEEYWYVDEGFLTVRVEVASVERRITRTGRFYLDVSLTLTVTSTPDGSTEEDVVQEVMDFIFSDLSGEVTGEPSDEPFTLDE